MWYIGCKALKTSVEPAISSTIFILPGNQSKKLDRFDLAVMTLFRLLGWKVSENKDKPFSKEFSALGVVIDFDRFLSGDVFFKNTDKRVKEVASSLRQAVVDESLSQKDLSRLRGRMLFAGGQLFWKSGQIVHFRLEVR